MILNITLMLLLNVTFLKKKHFYNKIKKENESRTIINCECDDDY